MLPQVPLRAIVCCRLLCAFHDVSMPCMPFAASLPTSYQNILPRVVKQSGGSSVRVCSGRRCSRAQLCALQLCERIDILIHGAPHRCLWVVPRCAPSDKWASGLTTKSTPSVSMGRTTMCFEITATAYLLYASARHTRVQFDDKP